MNTSFSDAIKEAFAIAPAAKVILHTLEFRQVGVQDSIYIVQARRAISAFDENAVEQVFEPVGFVFSLPPSNEEGFRSLNIAVDNIGGRAIEFVQTAMTETTPVEAVYRPYLSDDLSAPQMVPPLVLFLKDLKVDSHQITGRATFMDLVNRRFPSELYTRARFPSLG